MSKPELVQLPDGTWVDPEYVLAVEAIDETELTFGGYVGPRVIVCIQDGRWVLEYPSYDAACVARDVIARKVNGGRL